MSTTAPYDDLWAAIHRQAIIATHMRRQILASRRPPHPPPPEEIALASFLQFSRAFTTEFLSARSGIGS